MKNYKITSTIEILHTSIQDKFHFFDYGTSEIDCNLIPKIIAM